MAAKTRDHLTDQLFKAILSLKSEEQCSNFFEDICTISELKSMAQRLEVASIVEEIFDYRDFFRGKIRNLGGKPKRAFKKRRSGEFHGNLGMGFLKIYERRRAGMPKRKGL